MRATSRDPCRHRRRCRGFRHRATCAPPWLDLPWLDLPWLDCALARSAVARRVLRLQLLRLLRAVTTGRRRTGSRGRSRCRGAAVVVVAHAPMLSPCAMCAGTAGAAMLIVCSPPLPVLWQTSIFSWPLPKSPPSASIAGRRGLVRAGRRDGSSTSCSKWCVPCPRNRSPRTRTPTPGRPRTVLRGRRSSWSASRSSGTRSCSWPAGSGSSRS